jgi:hypothetical protein
MHQIMPTAFAVFEKLIEKLNIFYLKTQQKFTNGATLMQLIL